MGEVPGTAIWDVFEELEVAAAPAILHEAVEFVADIFKGILVAMTAIGKRSINRHLAQELLDDFQKLQSRLKKTKEKYTKWKVMMKYNNCILKLNSPNKTSFLLQHSFMTYFAQKKVKMLPDWLKKCNETATSIKMCWML